jgi:F5/8 type C domain
MTELSRWRDSHEGRRRVRAHLPPAWILAVCITALDAMPAELPPMQLLDGFDDIRSWHLATSDDVRATLRLAAGSQGTALCMDFDFGAVSGYAVARRELPLEYRDNYEFSFDLRGDGPPNTLQFKLVDASGQNVWWVNRPDYSFPHEWQRVRFKKRHISFAWGPAQDRELRHSAELEFVVARGSGGGKGTVCFDQLSFRELPVSTSESATLVRASSTLAPTQPAQAFDQRMDTAWRSDPAAGPEQTLILDFQQPREFGGLVLHWLADVYASRYAIDFSDDGEHWRTMREVADGNGGADPHLLPESETRYVRVRLQAGPAKAYALAEIVVKDLAFGASPNAFIEAIAKDAPRGHYPRGFVGEQSYWTVLGVSGGSAQGLLSEDGALEIGLQSGSIEPFLLTPEGLVTWADVEIKQSLLDNYLPIPTVSWQHRDLALRVTAFGAGAPAKSQLIAQYLVENQSDRARVVTLALAIRPFQVNPPTQFLNIPGGVSPIRELSWDGQALGINGQRRLFPIEQPDRVLAADFDAGNVPELLGKRQPPLASAITDATGLASAVLLYRLELPPRGSRTVGLVAPLAGAPALPAENATDWLSRQQTETANYWRATLNLVALRLPAAGQPLVNTLRTALAHILISRAGPALRPGSRSYARSWIRDGAMMSDALLRLGHADAVREYAEWFAPYQFANGKVPCCVDSRGSDPVAENDSQGELIHLIAQYYRYTGDRAWLQRMWPHVASAVTYMNSLRATERTAQNQSEQRRAFYGLMPASISHEGYSDRPAYSYWDDFWALAGYNGAVEIARALGRADDVGRLTAQREEFRNDLLASVRASIAQHGIDYIPGSADRGDFDATATTIALSVSGQQADLPRHELEETFERYWRNFLARRDGGTNWNDYTPYELRTVGSYVRLGWRTRAWQLLEFFLADRRPSSWNQWAEVVGRDARQPRFLGDMPHAWVASDFIQSVLDLFAYERASDQSLVLAAGVPGDWVLGQGIEIDNLRTPYGKLTYTLRQNGSRLLLTIAGGLTPPPGGLIFSWSSTGKPARASLNGRLLQWENDKELRVHTLPAVIAIEMHVDGKKRQ